MPKWIHRVLEVDKENKIVLCANCGYVSLRWQSVPGKPPRPMCGVAKRQRQGSKGNPQNWKHYKHKNNQCERCGFIPINSCQLHLHHKDRDTSNNDPSNLETLCANCHALEHAKKSRNKK